MSIFSVKSLAKIALLGGFVIPATGYGTRWLIQEKVKNSASHTEVVELVRNHDEAKRLLGEPFKIGRIDIGDESAYGEKENGLIKWFTLPISGPNASGNLRYWVNITNADNNEFQVSKIRIRVKERNKEETKRTLLLKNIENTDKSEKK